MKDMYGHVNRATLRRAAIDFTLALGLFWLLTFALSSHDGRAHAVPLGPQPGLVEVAPERVNRLRTLLSFETRSSRPTPPSTRQSLGLLSLAFALLAALNLAIWRHLRRAYASPRRGVWRRG
jgi:hypothetical protein